MLKLLANAAVALTLILSVSLPAPAWSAGKASKCTNAKHKHVKRVTTTQPARGIMIVEHRKQDVQILSFGP